ncbi:hypothetical protein QRN89_27610 [Streptomyces chengbuensis]|uniref:hypothetical protein n=1 Tax=Streptomyces sp. NPDC019208 TaxID=3154683 RepID=UPI0025B49242|nr:hypothetical protein [Streptomyces sp. HUAS CB01]WJY53243.1 hypothetical protein QRN89_27610 [Streptomyces sp. HUAS CB01]
MTAKLRASMAGHPAEPAWKVPLKRLQSASPRVPRCVGPARGGVRAEQAQADPQRPRRRADSTTRIRRSVRAAAPGRSRTFPSTRSHGPG